MAEYVVPTAPPSTPYSYNIESGAQEILTIDKWTLLCPSCDTGIVDNEYFIVHVLAVWSGTSDDLLDETSMGEGKANLPNWITIDESNIDTSQ